MRSRRIQRAGSYSIAADDVRVTIDAPLENLALYQYLMAPGGCGGESMAERYGPLA